MYFKHKYTNIYYEKEGNSDKSIIILPGWGNTRHTFQFLIDYLKSNYTVYIFDYPGFGNSPPIHKEFTISDYATIINDFLLEKKISNPVIIAHSFGGRITAVLLGRFHINAQKVILLDVAGIKRKNIRIFFKTYIYKLIKKVCIIFHQQSLLKKIRAYFSSNDYFNIPPYMYQTFKNIINEDLRDAYINIKNNVLIIWGENDMDTPIKDAYFLNRIIKNSGLIIYSNSGHFSYLDKPYLTIKILDSFLNKKDMD